MKKSISPKIWALSLLILASTFCAHRVNSQVTLPQGQEASPPETLEQREQRETFQFKLKQAREQNYRAKLNNGSKRGGLKPEELPEEIRAAAAAAAKQYREEIYPRLKQHTATHNGQLPQAAFTLPEFEPFMQDMQYKGVGPKSYGRGSWAIGAGFRMDDTVVTRDIYSNDPPDKPHDVWANFNKFANYPSLGKGFIVNGWDDGRVTFDAVDRNYYGIGVLMGQKRPAAATPGQAGIPPEFKQGLKTWMKKLDKDIQDAKPSQKNQLEAGETKQDASTKIIPNKE